MNTDFDRNHIRMHTAIRIQRKVTTREPGQLDPSTVWIDLGNSAEDDPPRWRRCQWTNAHGAESIRDGLATGKQTATLVLRYDARITPQCRVLRDGESWTIIGVDDVRMAHRWMEVVIERAVSA